MGVKPDAAITAEDVGYKLAPRLNAAGRLGCARLAVELLTTTAPGKAAELAQFLETQNGQRQALERKITQQAKEIVDRDFAKDAAVVVGAPDWHPGVVGIVASRLVDHYRQAGARDRDAGKQAIRMPLRPAADGASRGSRCTPRSTHATRLLEGHGGHAAAAGFKVRPERIAQFRNRFNAYVANHFPGGTPAPRLVLDAEVPLSALTFGLMKDLDKLEPYGALEPEAQVPRGGVEGRIATINRYWRCEEAHRLPRAAGRHGDAVRGLEHGRPAGGTDERRRRLLPRVHAEGQRVEG